MGKALRTHQKQSDGLDGYVALLLYPTFSRANHYVGTNRIEKGLLYDENSMPWSVADCFMLHFIGLFDTVRQI